jgi:taurine dioxygenase
MTVDVGRLAYGLGAEIVGLDLREPLQEQVIAAIRRAWLDNLVLVFPAQDLSLQQQISFSERFGELEVHPEKHFQHPHHPAIFEVTNRLIDGKPSASAEVGRQWHSDGAFTLRPPTGSLLHCRQLPSVGGDTWFTNMYAAFDSLSEALKKVVRTLEVVNDLGRVKGMSNRGHGIVDDHLHDNPPVVQPMVRVHPETGREALYLNESVTCCINGMTEEESEGLLKFLFRQSVRAEFTYRHRWRKGDVLLWDNRCSMHLAPKDYDGSEVRQMFRTTLRGEPLGRLFKH